MRLIVVLLLILSPLQAHSWIGLSEVFYEFRESGGKLFYALREAASPGAKGAKGVSTCTECKKKIDELFGKKAYLSPGGVWDSIPATQSWIQTPSSQWRSYFLRSSREGQIQRDTALNGLIKSHLNQPHALVNKSVEEQIDLYAVVAKDRRVLADALFGYCYGFTREGLPKALAAFMEDFRMVTKVINKDSFLGKVSEVQEILSRDPSSADPNGIIYAFRSILDLPQENLDLFKRMGIEGIDNIISLQEELTFQLMAKYDYFATHLDTSVLARWIVSTRQHLADTALHTLVAKVEMDPSLLEIDQTVIEVFELFPKAKEQYLQRSGLQDEVARAERDLRRERIENLRHLD